MHLPVLPGNTGRSTPDWHREPFRLFFPLAVVLGWIGVGHWLLYTLGVTSSFSGFLHGQIMMQAFMMAFAIGFLMTAVPRRTQAGPPSTFEMGAAIGLLLTFVIAVLGQHWMPAQLAYVALFVLLLQFAVRRFLRGGGARRPPASFVLVPIAVAHGVVGAALIALASRPGAAAWMIGLGRLLVEQGVFLCLAIGIGSLVLPLMAGSPPPADLGSAPAERWKAVGYAALGLAIAASFVCEQAGWLRAAPIVRGLLVAGGLAFGGGAWRPPGKPGLHRRLVWISVWLMPVGLIGAGVFPDLRIAALHVLFIGGFSLMGFGVATHVSLSHLDLETLALRSPAAVMVLGGTVLLAMVARVAADLSHTYFDHLGWAAALWLVGSGVWLAFFGPKLRRP
jgi:uncharacterized protein involved in response to NO